jgi:hypothetical protein
MLKSELLSSVAGLGVLSDGSLDQCRIVQGMSGELKRGDKRYQPEARIGAFFLEGLKPPIIDGETGFKCVWVHTRPAVVESAADGSLGTLAVYRDAPGDALWREEIDENGRSRRVWRRQANRNILTRTMFGSFALVNGKVDFDQLFVMRFTGKAVRTFYDDLVKPLGRRSMWVPDETGKRKPLPIFGVTTHVTTELASNANGDSWYVPKVEILAKVGDHGGPTEADIDVAKEIYEERQAHSEANYTPPPQLEDPPAPTVDGQLPSPIPAGPKPTPTLGTPGARITAEPDEGPMPFAPLEDEWVEYNTLS